MFCKSERLYLCRNWKCVQYILNSDTSDLNVYEGSKWLPSEGLPFLFQNGRWNPELGGYLEPKNLISQRLFVIHVNHLLFTIQLIESKKNILPNIVHLDFYSCLKTNKSWIDQILPDFPSNGLVDFSSQIIKFFSKKRVFGQALMMSYL